jgi:hypothetical protein
MNGDSLELMNAIRSMHVDFVGKLGEVKTEVAGINGTLTARMIASDARI